MPDLSPAQREGQQLTVTLTDQQTGKTSLPGYVSAPDLREPDAPSNVAIDDTGTHVTGNGKPGNRVKVYDADHKKIGEAIVGPDGTFDITVVPAQTQGETLTVTQTSPLNIEGPATEIWAPDLTEPQAPHDLELDATGETVTGEGHAGNKVTVYDADGNIIGTGVIDQDGHFSVPVSPAQIHGETITVTQTSAYDVESQPGTVGAPDLTPPEEPYNIEVDLTGTHVTGNGAAGNTVKVYDDNGNVIGEGTVGPDGKFDVTVTPAQTHGETLTVKQTTTYGVEGDAAEAHAPDLTPPAEPTDVAVDDTGLFVSGKGAPGNTIKVYDADHNLIGEGKVGDDGNFKVDLDERQSNGEHLTVTQTSQYEVESQPADAFAPDLTPPAAPTELHVTDDGLHITGKGIAGNTIKVYGTDGTTVLGTGTVDESGNFNVAISPAQTHAEELTVTQTNPYGVEGPPNLTLAPDLTIPEAPEGVHVDETGSTVTGEGRPGAGVAVKNGDGDIIGTGTVDPDGNFVVELNPKQEKGEHLEVVLINPITGEESVPTGVDAPDLTPPAMPTDLHIDNGGVVVTGKGTAGNKVTVYDPDGNVVGTGVVNGSGVFAVALEESFTNGETLTVTQTSPFNVESQPADALAPDLTEPDAPSDVAIDDTGTHVTGNGKPGNRVKVYDADHKKIGEAIVGPDGSFDITVVPAQTQGETLTVTQTSPQNIEGPSAELNAPDLTEPQAPHDLELDATGETVTGEGHAGNKVTVYDADGNIIGTGVIDQDGHFSVPVSPAQIHGETITVTQTSAYDVESQPGTVGAPDLTPPEEPYNIEVDLTGTHVTGNGAAGNTVKVYDDNGNVIGEGTVGPDGKFDVTVTPAQTHGETLTVKQTTTYGVEGDAAEAHAPDLTPPAEPTDLVVATDGWSVTGKAVVGNTVKVYDANHTLIGEGTADQTGTFNIHLDIRQMHGEHLTVTQTSQYLVESLPGDAYAPELSPINVAFDEYGSNLTGEGIAGATIRVYDDNNKLVGTGVVGQDGKFTVSFWPYFTNHEHFSVEQQIPDLGASSPVETYAPALPQDSLVSTYDNSAIAARVDVTLLNNGGWLLTYRVSRDDGTSDSSQLYQQRYDSQGNKVGDTVLLKQDDMWINYNIPGLTVTVLKDGGWFILEAYKNDNQTNHSTILLRQYDENGQQIGAEKTLATGTNSYIGSAALANGGYVVVWEGHQQVYDAAGTLVKDNATAVAGRPSIFTSGDGYVVVGLRGITQEIEMARMDQFGNQVGATQTIGSYSNMSNQTVAHGATLEDGTFVITWGDEKGYHAAHFDENGNKIGNQFDGYSPHEITSGTNNGQPHIAALAEGGFVIVWYGKDEVGQWWIFQQEYDAEANKIGSIMPVQTNFGTKSIGGSDFDVIGLEDGGWLVAFKGSDGNNIYQQRFDSEGHRVEVAIPFEETLSEPQNIYFDEAGAFVSGEGTVGARAKVYDATGKEVGNGLVGSDGLFHINFWPNYTNHEQFTVKLEIAASRQQSPSVETYAPALPQDSLVSTYDNSAIAARVDVTLLNNGGWLLTYRVSRDDGTSDSSQLYQQRYDSQGNKVGDTVLLKQDDMWINYNIPGLTVTVLKDGGWFILEAYKNDNQTNHSTILLRQYDENGQQIGAEKTLATGTNSYIGSAALANGGYVVVWEGHQQVYDAAGTLVKDNATAVAGRPSIFTSGDGYVVVGLRGITQEIEMARMDQFGNQVGATQTIGSYSNMSNQTVAHGATLEDGTFVITWGDEKGYHAAHFDENGNKIGNQFDGYSPHEITSGTNNGQPHIAALAEGGFVIVWYGKDEVGQWWIFQQEYDAEANKIGSIMPVQTNFGTKSIGGSDFDVIGLEDGGWLVAFKGSDGNNIYQQRFDSEGHRVPIEYIATSDALETLLLDNDHVEGEENIHHDTHGQAPTVHPSAEHVGEMAVGEPATAGGIGGLTDGSGDGGVQPTDAVALALAAAEHSVGQHDGDVVASGDNASGDNVDLLHGIVSESHPDGTELADAGDEGSSDGYDEQKVGGEQGSDDVTEVVAVADDGSTTEVEGSAPTETEVRAGGDQPLTDENVGVSETQMADATDGHTDASGDGVAEGTDALNGYSDVVALSGTDGSDSSESGSVSESDALALNGDADAEDHGDDMSDFAYAPGEDLYDLSQLGSASDVAPNTDHGANNNAVGFTVDDLVDRDTDGAIDLGQFGDGNGAGDDIGMVTENAPVSVGSGPDTSVSSAFSEPGSIYDVPSSGGPNIWIDDTDRVVA